MFSIISVQKMFIFDFYCFRSHLYQTCWENCHKSMHIRWKIQQNLNICTLFQVPQKPLWTWKKIPQRHFSKNILKMWNFDECCVTKWGGGQVGSRWPPDYLFLFPPLLNSFFDSLEEVCQTFSFVFRGIWRSILSGAFTHIMELWKLENVFTTEEFRNLLLNLNLKTLSPLQLSGPPLRIPEFLLLLLQL